MGSHQRAAPRLITVSCGCALRLLHVLVSQMPTVLRSGVIVFSVFFIPTVGLIEMRRSGQRKKANVVWQQPPCIVASLSVKSAQCSLSGSGYETLTPTVSEHDTQQRVPNCYD